MNNPFIFVSCGQHTEAEKGLGNSIVATIRTVTGLEVFFAEQVQDLNGLDTNILAALRDCAGLVVVMHPRGEIIRPDKSHIIRASVWIEQEIAIATYIQRVEKRPLPIIAFLHESVGREGIRGLLHLNPIRFAHEDEVIAALRERLPDWKTLSPTGICIQLQITSVKQQDGHRIRQLTATLVNNTNQRLTTFTFEIRVPADLLRHGSASYRGEIGECEPGRRCFRRDDTQTGPISPQSKKSIFSIDYCTECAIANTGDDPRIAALLIEEREVVAKVWIDNKEYSLAKTIKELAQDASARRV